MIWPPVRYSYRTVNNELPDPAPSKPSWLYYAEERCSRYPQGRQRCELHLRQLEHCWAPTIRRATCWRACIYGFRISVLFGLILTPSPR